ncbi:MAG: hypothetical protein QGD94_11065, partial [Planctomycetia bacterium]|nr:hypothetical protein [Planctomycetia bacterium]
IWTFQGHGFSGPKGYWAQEVTPGTVLVGRDSARVGRRGGFLDDKQLKWLDETLNTYREKAVIIIAHHGLTNFHPFDESVVWQHLTVRNSAAVRDVISRHPNVILAITGHHHFAAGKAIGHVVHIASPSLTVWPLAYHLIRINKKSVETLWLPIGSDKLQAKARGRLFADHEWRGPFPAGEQGDTELIRLFGAHKSQTFKFAEIRP